MTEIILNGSREIIRGDRLGAALSVIDRFSETEPTGEVTLFLNGMLIEPSKNLSGYYLFFDLPGDTAVIRVISEYYYPGVKTVTPADLDPLNPLIEIFLIPRVSYPFPPGATLIRGGVVDGAGSPVPDAVVRQKGRDVATKTDGNGEFVLFFTHLSPGDTVFNVAQGKRFLKGPPPPLPAEIRVEAEKGPLTGSQLLFRVEEGTTFVLAQAITITA